MTTALDRTPKLGERWHWMRNGRIVGAKVVRTIGRQIYLQRRSDEVYVCVDCANLFSQANACKKFHGIQKPSVLSRLRKKTRAK